MPNLLVIITKFYFAYLGFRAVLQPLPLNHNDIEYINKSDPQNINSYGVVIAFIFRLLLYTDIGGYILIGYYITLGVIPWLGIVLMLTSIWQIYLVEESARYYDNFPESIQKILNENNRSSYARLIYTLTTMLFFLICLVYLIYSFVSLSC